MGYDVAYELAKAMHADRDIEFDEETCTITPYSPWEPQ